AFVNRSVQYMGTDLQPYIAMTSTTRGVDCLNARSGELFDQLIRHPLNIGYPFHASCKLRSRCKPFRDKSPSLRCNKGEPLSLLFQWPGEQPRRNLCACIIVKLRQIVAKIR